MPTRNLFSILATAALVTLFILPGMETASGAEDSSAAGRWIVSSDFFGTPLTFILVLEQAGEKLSGDFEGDKLEGSISGDAVHFLARDEHGGIEECQAVLKAGTLSGTLIFAGSDDPVRKETPSAVVVKIKPVTASPTSASAFFPKILRNSLTLSSHSL